MCISGVIGHIWNICTRHTHKGPSRESEHKDCKSQRSGGLEQHSASCNPNTSYELTVAVAACTRSRQSTLYHEKKGRFIIHTLNWGVIDRWWLLRNCVSVFESKKGCGFGQVGKWGGSRKSWRGRSHNQDILYEKNLFSLKKRRVLPIVGSQHSKEWPHAQDFMSSTH